MAAILKKGFTMEKYIVWYWSENFGHSTSVISAYDAIEAAQTLKESILKKYGENHKLRIIRVNPEKN